MSSSKMIASLTLAASAMLALSTSAHAGVFVSHGGRGGIVAARGPNGAGVVAVGREGGYYAAGRRTDGMGNYQANRTVETPWGKGYQTNRSGSCSSGTCAGSSVTTLNNGKTIDRSYSATRNPDGSVSYDRSRTGVNGQTRTVSGTY